jgi:hypothetical protein
MDPECRGYYEKKLIKGTVSVDYYSTNLGGIGADAKCVTNYAVHTRSFSALNSRVQLSQSSHTSLGNNRFIAAKCFSAIGI